MTKKTIGHRKECGPKILFQKCKWKKNAKQEKHKNKNKVYFIIHFYKANSS